MHSKKPAELVIINATVYTADEKFSKVESFAVAGGKIIGSPEPRRKFWLNIRQII
jgi:predicted amidohydrolase YtcJ